MNTRFTEEIIRTQSLRKMQDKYLAERLLRSWKEDFVDEDSGEVVAIERNELILEKGTQLAESEITIVNFHMQSGDVKNVLVSNQKRQGSIGKREACVWQVTATNGLKKYNLYLYANSITKAQEIVTDYLEQQIVGIFTFVSIKELDDSVLIPENFGLNEEEAIQNFDADYYKMEVQIVKVDFEFRTTFIVKAEDAEKAKDVIANYLEFQRKENQDPVETVLITIITAKTISCDYVIDNEFSLEYMQDED